MLPRQIRRGPIYSLTARLATLRGNSIPGSTDGIYHMTRIIGHGVDIVELAEFQKLLDGAGGHLAERCFTEHELAYAGNGPNRIARLAARFAAKEALLKALGTGWTTGVSLKAIEIFNQPTGAPVAKISGAIARIATDRGATAFELSLSHTTTLAIASVIALAELPKPV
jgi:holo-[acyl-carrier protein] synthase